MCPGSDTKAIDLHRFYGNETKKGKQYIHTPQESSQKVLKEQQNVII